MDAQRQPFQRILDPTDLGDGAERALARVPWLPLAENASLFLLHCVPGEPAGTENARTAVERWLLGSVAETVLRVADCDVLVASDL